VGSETLEELDDFLRNDFSVRSVGGEGGRGVEGWGLGGCMGRGGGEGHESQSSVSTGVNEGGGAEGRTEAAAA